MNVLSITRCSAERSVLLFERSVDEICTGEKMAGVIKLIRNNAQNTMWDKTLKA